MQQAREQPLIKTPSGTYQPQDRVRVPVHAVLLAGFRPLRLPLQGKRSFDEVAPKMERSVSLPGVGCLSAISARKLVPSGAFRGSMPVLDMDGTGAGWQRWSACVQPELCRALHRSRPERNSPSFQRRDLGWADPKRLVPLAYDRGAKTYMHPTPQRLINRDPGGLSTLIPLLGIFEPRLKIERRRRDKLEANIIKSLPVGQAKWTTQDRPDPAIPGVPCRPAAGSLSPMQSFIVVQEPPAAPKNPAARVHMPAVLPMGEMVAATPTPGLRVKMGSAGSIISGAEAVAPAEAVIHDTTHASRFNTAYCLPGKHVSPSSPIADQAGPLVSAKFVALDSLGSRIAREQGNWKRGDIASNGTARFSAVPVLQSPILVNENLVHPVLLWNPVPTAARFGSFTARFATPSVPADTVAAGVPEASGTRLPVYPCLPSATDLALPPGFATSLCRGRVPAIAACAPAIANMVPVSGVEASENWGAAADLSMKQFSLSPVATLPQPAGSPGLATSWSKSRVPGIAACAPAIASVAPVGIDPSEYCAVIPDAADLSIKQFSLSPVAASWDAPFGSSELSQPGAIIPVGLLLPHSAEPVRFSVQSLNVRVPSAIQYDASVATLAMWIPVLATSAHPPIQTGTASWRWPSLPQTVAFHTPAINAGFFGETAPPVAIAPEHPILAILTPHAFKLSAPSFALPEQVRLEQRLAPMNGLPVRQSLPDSLSSQLVERYLNPTLLRFPPQMPGKRLECARPSPRRLQDWIPIGFQWRRKTHLWERRRANWKAPAMVRPYPNAWPDRLANLSDELLSDGLPRWRFSELSSTAQYKDSGL